MFRLLNSFSKATSQLVLFLLITTICAPSFSETVISKGDVKISGFLIEYLYDEKSVLDIDSIQSKVFPEIISSQFTKGYRSGKAWFKITLKNTSDKENFILYFTEPFWSSIKLYTPNSNLFDFINKNNRWIIEENALNIPLKQRNIQDVNPAFKIYIPNGQTKTFYVEGYSESSHIGEFQLFSEKEYYRPSRFSISNLYMFYSALLIFLVVIITLFFAMLKEKLYLLYVGYVFPFISWLFVLSGNYLLLGFNGWNEGLHTLGTIFIGFLILFSGEFLELKNFYPRINKVFNVSALIIFFSGILIFLGFNHVSIFFNIFSSMFFLLLFVVVIKLLIKQSFNNLNYYFYALLIYMPTMGLMTMSFNGFIENTDISRYAYILGSLCEVLLFSYILVKRFNDSKASELNLINRIKRQTSDFETKVNIDVQKRTNDLTKTNQRLMKDKESLFIDSITDELSGLYNRRYFEEIAKTLFDSSKRNEEPLALMLIDIDLFKNINDKYGHMIGDEVIMTCSNTLKKFCRSSDVVVRYGGDEFIILLPNTEKEQAMALAERIREHSANNVKFVGDKNSFKVTFSIGLSQIDYSLDKNIKDIFERADEAMYSAKKKGRDRVKTKF